MEAILGKLMLAVVLTGALITGFPLAAKAMSLPAQIEAGASANIIDVAVHCGPHAHYVRGHRDPHTHHYIRGRCVRDRH
jgi:hypothetical protein